MIKFRLFFNKDKEAEWLNEMSGQGYALTGFCMGFFHFDRCQPGEYVYQIDFTEGIFRAGTDYREFMAEAGVEIVCLWGYWIFLRKKSSDGPFELYTDVESSIEHYTKIRNMFKIVTFIELAALFAEIMAAAAGWGYAKICACVIILMLAALARETMRLNGMLAELKARIGQSPETGRPGCGRRHSRLLTAGLLLNALVIIARNILELPAVEEAGPFLTGIAAGLILLGVWRTASRLQ